MKLNKNILKYRNKKWQNAKQKANPKLLFYNILRLFLILNKRIFYFE